MLRMLLLSIPRCQKSHGVPLRLSVFGASRLLRVDLSRAGDQLVPTHHTFAQVHFVQPHIGLPDQGLLHKLATIGHQKQLV